MTSPRSEIIEWLEKDYVVDLMDAPRMWGESTRARAGCRASNVVRPMFQVLPDDDNLKGAARMQCNRPLTEKEQTFWLTYAGVFDTSGLDTWHGC